MLAAMLGLLAVLVGLLRASLRSRGDLVVENLLLRHQRRPDPPDPQALPASPAGQVGLGPRPPALPRLATPPDPGPARDRRRLAPPGLAAVLVVALPLPH